MKSILAFINEALINKDTKIRPGENKSETTSSKSNTKWVAIEIVTKDNSYASKEITNQRVVTLDTYQNLKQGRTKGYRTVVSVYTLGPVCSSRDAAMAYLDPPNKSKRKTKINPKGANYVAWCISSGKMNPSGKTYWDWNFWDEWKDNEIYMGRGGAGISFLCGSPGSFKVGDTVLCIDNNSEKKLAGAPEKIDAISKCNIDDFRQVFRDTWPSLCKPPKRAFGKVSDGLPWTNRMGQIYSIKGIVNSSNL